MPDEYVRNAVNDPADGDSALRDLMNLDRRPTAVVCTTDHLATGVASRRGRDSGAVK